MGKASIPARADRHSFKWRALRVCFLAIAAAAISSSLTFDAQAETLRRLTLEQMSQKSDVIVIGRVVAKRSELADGHIQTHYEIDANEYLKGQEWIDRGLVGSTVEITQIGGSLSGPLPVTQRVSSLPEMFKQEKVLLFLDMKSNHGKDGKKASKRKTELRAAQLETEGPRGISPNSKLLTTPVIVGAWQGRFTIFAGKDGSESAIQVRSDLSGLPKNEGFRKHMKAAAQRSARGGSELDGEAEVSAPDLLVPKALQTRARTIDDLKADIREAVEKQAAGQAGQSGE